MANAAVVAYIELMGATYSGNRDRETVLDCLRGVAALMVLLVHWGTTGVDPKVETGRLFMSVEPAQTHDNLIGRALDVWDCFTGSIWPLNIQFASGGVLLFFLISGYVIPISVERYSTTSFAIRRTLRLLPTLWAAIAIWLGLNALLQVIGYARGQPFSWQQIIANGFLVHDWLWYPNIDAAFWTLLIEAKFYVLMAVLASFGRRISLGQLACAVGMLAILSVPFFDRPGNSDYEALLKQSNDTGLWWVFFFYRVLNTDAPYIVYMMIGTVIFMWTRGRLLLGQAAVVVGALFAVFATLFLIGPTGFGQLGYVDSGLKALALFVGILALDRAGVLARLPWLMLPLRFVGTISYPLYLTHGLIGMSVILAVYTATGSLTLGLACGAGLVFPLAWAINRFVELPGQALGKKIDTAIGRPSAKAADSARTTQLSPQ